MHHKTRTFRLSFNYLSLLIALWITVFLMNVFLKSYLVIFAAGVLISAFAMFFMGGIGWLLYMPAALASSEAKCQLGWVICRNSITVHNIKIAITALLIGLAVGAILRKVLTPRDGRSQANA